MIKKLLVASMAIAGFSACNTQNAITEHTAQAAANTDKPALSLQDIIPAQQATTPEEKQKQQEFVTRHLDRFKSRRMAGAFYVAEAQRTFNEGKTDSTDILLNRAWLMDSTNHDIFWVYGLTYGQQKEYDKAIYALYYALEFDKENPRLLTDIATSYLGRFYEESNLDDLHQSRKLLEEAARLDKDNPSIFYKLAVNSYYLKEYSKAWEYLHQSIKQDKKQEDKTFISALLEKQQDPEGIYSRQNVQ
ncbi:hypothetical protein [Pontibacter sp. SGAir0037]|uniref:tetratricopeptide repeat protein n=1 Tax=Pontibacter sp. SGAir0037 TaxID=2571030 RepID=UPI0010CD0E10|nr:hypothetical protein [Pontibacter sp. SGAir0037]QCR21873.1 hypothetical protein C1N53_05660 [Pontibacter sp. SGAir0037]